MSDSMETKLEYLRGLRVGEFEHSTRSLLEHLVATRSIVERWGCRDVLCDAALFHSVYGTDTYEKSALPIERRDEVVALIGEQAERLVYVFCTKDRATYLEAVQALPAESLIHNRLEGVMARVSADELVDIVQIEAANALEQWQRLPLRNKRRAAPMLRCITPHVVDQGGREQIDSALRDVDLEASVEG